jgi:hypothetical protein
MIRVDGALCAGHSMITGRSILYNSRYSVLVWGVVLDHPFHRPSLEEGYWWRSFFLASGLLHIIDPLGPSIPDPRSSLNINPLCPSLISPDCTSASSATPSQAGLIGISRRRLVPFPPFRPSSDVDTGITARVGRIGRRTTKGKREGFPVETSGG